MADAALTARSPAAVAPDSRQLAELGASLPALASESAWQPRPGKQAYLEYYGIDLGGEFPGLRHGLGTVESAGRRLAVQVFRPVAARGKLLLVHGYLDHVGIYGQALRYGLQRGLTVVAYDQPGHGLSGGERVSIEDFGDYGAAIEAVLEACRDLPGDWFCLAQSMGGAALLEYLRRNGAGAFTRAVLLAPLLRPHGWRRVSLAWCLLHRFRSSVPRSFVVNSHDPVFLDFLGREPLQSRVIAVAWVGALRRWLARLPDRLPIELPVLLIQGREDRTVDWRYNVPRYQRLLPGLAVEFIAEARHQMVNESAAIRERWMQLADRHFGLDGSGAAPGAADPDR